MRAMDIRSAVKKARAHGRGLPAQLKKEANARWRTRGVAQIGTNCFIQGKPLVNPEHISLGKSVIIRRGSELLAQEGKPITLGDAVSINQGVLIRPNVTIGNRVSIGARSVLWTDSHEMGTSYRRTGPGTSGPIVIGDGVWIGIGCIILPGVTIGAGAVIGAGALVSRDCEPNGVYTGTPAKLRRTLRPDEGTPQVGAPA